MQPEQSGPPVTADHARLRPYQPAGRDPAWLARAADFHGHLGPWVVVGAMIGRDALPRLNTTGQWEVEVICWMPPEKQRPPFTCLLDGLQASTGATTGKQNIRIDFDPAIVSSGQPVVYILHKAPNGVADRGVAYEVGPTLSKILARSSPDRIEAISREIASHEPDELLVPHVLAAADLAKIRLNPAASTGAAEPSRSVPSTLRVALCQTYCTDGDAEGNLRRVEYAIEEAARQHATLACFPESCVLGWINPEAHSLADPIPGPASERIAGLARRHKLFICIGLDEKDGDRLYDSAILVGPDGQLLTKHRKINNLSEAMLMDPPYTDGDPGEIRAVETPIGRVGLLICADTFVEQYVQAMGGQKPDLLLVPYGWAAENRAWPGHARQLAETVSQAARWAGCPVVGTDCVGLITHGPWTGRTYGGQSVAADRNGQVLEILRDRDAEVRVVEIVIGRAD